MALYPDGGDGAEVTEEQLWRHVVLDHHGTKYSAREVVQFAAHVLGGVHLREPRDQPEKLMAELEKGFRALDIPIPLFVVRDIGLVVLPALMPLAKQIAARHTE